MNETIKAVGGGADPVVSAVLNAVGKRYLVETYSSSDGFGGYELYSDGTIFQYGHNDGSQKIPTIALHKEMANTGYLVDIMNLQREGEVITDNAARCFIVVGQTTTSFNVRQTYSTANGNGLTSGNAYQFDWKVYGKVI